MDREYGAKEACDFVRSINFAPSTIAFDKDFMEEGRVQGQSLRSGATGSSPGVREPSLTVRREDAQGRHAGPFRALFWHRSRYSGF